MYKELYGILEMNDDGDYIIDNINLSKLLWSIFDSNSPFLSIKIESDTRTLFNSTGDLYFDKDDYGIWCWHVDGECLESVLFNHTNEKLYIVINTKAEVEAATYEVREIVYT